MYSFNKLTVDISNTEWYFIIYLIIVYFSSGGEQYGEWHGLGTLQQRTYSERRHFGK